MSLWDAQAARTVTAGAAATSGETHSLIVATASAMILKSGSLSARAVVMS